MLKKLPKHYKSAIIYFLGFFFLISGFIGLILPLVPQAIPIAIGLILISMENPKINTWTEKNLARWPHILSSYQKLHTKIHSIFN
jgi:uncharacterized membrane protein YbaN (DUF454 family)